MTVLPQLENELLAAHTRLGLRRRRLLRLPLGSANGAVVAVASLTAVAVAAFVLLTLRHKPLQHGPVRHGQQSIGTGPGPSGRSGPSLPADPTRRQQQEERYLQMALAAVTRRDKGCELVSQAIGGSPTISQGSPSRSLLSILAVLRRPARATDKLPVRITYHPYRRDPNGSLPQLKGIYVRYIRRARWRFGAGYYLVPAADANPLRPLPDRCYSEQRTALQSQLGRIPASLRGGTLALEPAFLRQLRIETTAREGVCLAALNDTGNGDGCGGGYTVSDIEQGHTLSSGGPTGVGVVYGVVPDGVATVTLSYTGRHSGHPLTVRAIDNVFILRNPHQRLPNVGFPDKIVWRSSDGAVIKTLNLREP